MKIQVINKIIQSDKISDIAVQYDSGIDPIEFEFVKSTIGENLSDKNVFIQYKNSSGTFIKPLNKTETNDLITVLWNLGRDITNISGVISFMLIFTSSADYINRSDTDFVWSTNMVTRYIYESLFVNNIEIGGKDSMEIIQNTMEMIRGDTETIRISKTDINDLIVPFDVGDVVYFTVKKSIHDAEKILQKIVSIFDNGGAVIRINHDDTKDIECGTYLYDVQLNDKNGGVTTIVKPSRFYIKGEITYE